MVPLLESGTEGSLLGPSADGKIHAFPLRFLNFPGFSDPHVISHFVSKGASDLSRAKDQQ